MFYLSDGKWKEKELESEEINADNIKMQFDNIKQALDTEPSITTNISSNYKKKYIFENLNKLSSQTTKEENQKFEEENFLFKQYDSENIETDTDVEKNNSVNFGQSLGGLVEYKEDNLIDEDKNKFVKICKYKTKISYFK
jgi:hypothetical protein